MQAQRRPKDDPVTMGRPSSDLLGMTVAEVDFKAYSAAHKVTEGGKEDDIPPVYEKMQAKYPNIDKPDFTKTTLRTTLPVEQRSAGCCRAPQRRFWARRNG